MLRPQARSVGFKARLPGDSRAPPGRGYRFGMLSVATAAAAGWSFLGPHGPFHGSSLCARTLVDGRQDAGDPGGVPRGDGPPEPPNRFQNRRARGLEIPAVQDHEGEQLANVLGAPLGSQGSCSRRSQVRAGPTGFSRDPSLPAVRVRSDRPGRHWRVHLDPEQ